MGGGTMSERPSLGGLSDGELDAILTALGEEIAYPPTPDLAGRVRRQLPNVSRPRWDFPWTSGARIWRPGLVALVVIFLVLAGALLLSPALRQGVADRLGLRHVSIRFVAS